MTFKEAFEAMKHGAKVKLPGWNGYWCWDDEKQTIMIHCRPKDSDKGQGEVLDIRETQRVEYTFMHTQRDDWMIADEENCGVLGGQSTFGFGDAIRYLKRGLKVARKGWNGKQYDSHEAETLKAVVDGRGQAGDIENVTTAITAVSEAYPELKSNENYKQLMNELSITENMIAEYRSNFNKQVKQYNRYVRKFPTSIFLNMTGYEKQSYSYLEYDVSEDAPQDLFGDK